MILRNVGGLLGDVIPLILTDRHGIHYKVLKSWREGGNRVVLYNKRGRSREHRDIYRYDIRYSEEMR